MNIKTANTLFKWKTSHLITYESDLLKTLLDYQWKFLKDMSHLVRVLSSQK